MEFLQQTSDSIVYVLCEEVIDLSQFKVLQQDTLTIGNMTITVGILAESHFVTLTEAGEVVSEICACTDSIETQTTPIVKARLTELPTPTVRHPFGGYEYQFSYAASPVRQYDAFCEQFSEPDLHLEQEFPKQPHEETAGITKLWVQANDHITIDTVHTYPHEEQMVTTRTVLEHKRH